jgi:hypothetical protein
LANRWGITLAPQVSNADAQDWINRVYANGGTVSTATAAAVNTFCNDIDAASLRSKFFRLNLFCGSGTSVTSHGVVVPLYRGASLGGTQYGNATDTPNAFALSDFSETLGVLGNASCYMTTGLAPSAVPSSATSHHMAAWKGAGSSASQRLIVAVLDNATTHAYRIGKNGGASGSLFTEVGSLSGATSSSAATNDTAGFLVGSRTSSTLLELMWKGSVVATYTTSVSSTPPTNGYDVFAMSPGHNGNWPLRLGGYSIGAGLSSTEAATYDSIMSSFQTSLGRGAS